MLASGNEEALLCGHIAQEVLWRLLSPLFPLQQQHLTLAMISVGLSEFQAVSHCGFCVFHFELKQETAELAVSENTFSWWSQLPPCGWGPR